MKRWSIALTSLLVCGLAGALVMTTGLQGQGTAPPAVPKELTSYREIVKRVLPAVVSVEAQHEVTKTVGQSPQRRPRAQTRPPFDEIPGLPEQFRRFFEEMPDMEAIPEDALPQHSFGSGFVIDPSGVVVTNNHVVGTAKRVKITFQDDSYYYSTDIKTDKKNDLAVIRFKTSKSLPYLEMGDSDAMEIGDRVLAVGAPFGLSGSVTAGIVSAKGRAGLDQSRSVYEDYLQTDAAINPGNSGGPLVNLAGQVIGINTAIKTRTGGFQGVGLAITSNVAKNIVDQLVKHGKVHRSYLGVSIGALTPDVAEQLGITGTKGVYVSNVTEGGPAAKAGLVAGDIITSVDGTPVKDSRELQHLVATLPASKKVDLQVIRDGKTLGLPVTLEEQPKDYGVVTRPVRSSRQQPEEVDEVKADKVGLTLSDLTPELASSFGYGDEAKGVLIMRAEPGSIAAEKGLHGGMLITKIGKKPVSSAVAAKNLLDKADLDKGVLLQVQVSPRQGGGSALIVLKAEAVEK
jgi:serine protease Do